MLKFIVARTNGDDAVYQSNIGSSVDKIDGHLCQVLDNPLTQDSIFKKYNSGIEYYLKDLNDTDVVIFCHNDVKIVDPNFSQKIETLFLMKPDIGLVGIIGCKQLNEGGAWWVNNNEKLCGHIIQGRPDGSEVHLVKGSVGYFDRAVCVDGCFFGIRGSLLKEGLRFDQETYSGYHFYDLDICFSVLEKMWKVAIADIMIFHKSVGVAPNNESWNKNKDLFINKWKTKGYKFPITVDNFGLNI